MNDVKPVDVPDTECLVCGVPFQSHAWVYSNYDGRWKRQYRAATACSRSHAAQLRKARQDSLVPRYLAQDVLEAFREWKLEEGCARCGYRGHHAALQCDHLDRGAKTATVSRLLGVIVANGKRAMVSEAAIKRLILELANCQVLCANCHSVKTFEDRDWVPRCGRG